MPTNPFGRDPRTNSPFPVPEKKGHFTQESASPLTFAAPDSTYGPTTGITSQAVWSSPLFDLRYGLGQVDGFSQRRQKNIEPNVLFGGGSHLNLFVKMNFEFSAGHAQSGLGAFRCYYIEFGEPMNPAKQQYLHEKIDITDAVFAGNRITSGLDLFISSIVQWEPQGPLRYWGNTIIVDKVYPESLVVGVPIVTISAALH